MSSPGEDDFRPHNKASFFRRRCPDVEFRAFCTAIFPCSVVVVLVVSLIVLSSSIEKTPCAITKAEGGGCDLKAFNKTFYSKECYPKTHDYCYVKRDGSTGEVEMVTLNFYETASPFWLRVAMATFSVSVVIVAMATCSISCPGIFRNNHRRPDN